MKTKLSIILLTLLSLILASALIFCGKVYKKLSFTEIAKGNLFSVNEGLDKQNIVITTQTEWDSLQAKMGGSQLNDFKTTEIDFETFQIIAVFDEVRPNLCWRIDITCIEEYSGKIFVMVAVKSTGERVCADVETCPYHIVKIPKTAKEILFRYRT